MLRDLRRSFPAIVVATLTIAPSALAQTTLDWAGAVDGAWSDGTKWSPPGLAPRNGIPAGSTYVARVLASGSPFQIDVDVDATISGLLVNSPDATLHIPSGSVLTVHDFLTLLEGDVEVDGGQLQWNSSAFQTFYSTGQINVTNAGSLNLDSPEWRNLGVINVTDSELILGGSSKLYNMGTINVAGASTVNLSTFSLDLSGRTFDPVAYFGGVAPTVYNNVWSNGTLDLRNTPTLDFDGIELHDVQVLGSLRGTRATLANTTFDGSPIQLSQGLGVGENVHFNGSPIALVGGLGFGIDQDIHLDLTFDAKVTGAVTVSSVLPQTVTFAPDSELHLIQGQSSFEGRGDRILQGLVRASDDATRLTFDCSYRTITNQGTIEALDGADLRFLGVGTFTNEGVVSAGGGGELTLASDWSNASGRIEVDDTIVRITSLPDSLSEIGDFSRTAQSDVRFADSIDLAGRTLDLPTTFGAVFLEAPLSNGTVHQSQDAAATLRRGFSSIPGLQDVTFTGADVHVTMTPELDLYGDIGLGDHALVYDDAPGSEIKYRADGTFSGDLIHHQADKLAFTIFAGVDVTFPEHDQILGVSSFGAPVGATTSGSLLNLGLIQSNPEQPDIVFNRLDTLENRGTVEILAGGRLSFVRINHLVNYDTTTLRGGSWILHDDTTFALPSDSLRSITDLEATLSISGPTTLVDGIADLQTIATDGDLRILDGYDLTLSSVLDVQGALTIGVDSTLSAPGITFGPDASLTYVPSSSLLPSDALGSTDPLGMIALSGPAMLAGDLRFDFSDLFAPEPGMLYTLLTAPMIEGRFANSTVVTPMGRYRAIPHYDEGAVRVEFVEVPAPGGSMILLAPTLLARRRRR